MITKIVLGSATGAAIALGGPATASAQAQEPPTYTHLDVHGSPDETAAEFNRQASNGAQPQGAFEGSGQTKGSGPA